MQIRSNSKQQQRASLASLQPWQLIGISDKDYTALVEKWSINEAQGAEVVSRIKAWLASDRNQELNLSGLGLTSLPPLPADLKKLNAANNLLSSLPEQLPPLLELNVRGNQLRRLPEELPTASLQMLNAVGNNLECVPANFHWLRPGCEIYMQGNSLLPDIQAPVGCFLDIDFLYELTLGSVTKVAAMLAEFPNAAGCIGSKGESPLLLAVQLCDMERVKLLISHPLTNVNQASQSGKTPLMVAIRRELDEIALLILQRPEIDLNKCSDQGDSALHLAVTLDRKVVVQRMLANVEIDPNQADSHGHTAMHLAILKNDLALFKLFLSCPLVNLHQLIKEGLSIIDLIAVEGHRPMLEALLDKVSVNQKWQQEMINDALVAAAANGQQQIVDLLLRKYRCNPDSLSNPCNSSAIGMAAQNGHIDIVRLLLHFNADPINQSEVSPPALHVAIAGRHKQVFELLLALPNMDPNTLDACGFTPLILAAQYGLSDYAVLLLQHKKIDINQTGNLGQTALLTAVLAGQQACFEQLMQDKRIDVNKASKNGHFPLYEACRLGLTAMVRQLISYKTIDLFAQQNDETTALNAAAQSGKSEIVEMLLDAMQAKRELTQMEILDSLVLCMVGGKIQVFQFLMERFRMTVHQKLPNGLTFLHLASKLGQPDFLYWLLKQGADPWQREVGGKLPLQLAAKNPEQKNGMNLLHLLMHGPGVQAIAGITEQREVVYAIGSYVIHTLTTVSEFLKKENFGEKFDSGFMADKKAKQSLAAARDLLNLLSGMKAGVLSTIFAAVALSSVEAFDLIPAEHPLLLQALAMSPDPDPESRARFYASIRDSMKLWDGEGIDGAGQGTFSVLGTMNLSRLPPLTRHIRNSWGI